MFGLVICFIRFSCILNFVNQKSSKILMYAKKKQRRKIVNTGFQLAAKIKPQVKNKFRSKISG